MGSLFLLLFAHIGILFIAVRLFIVFDFLQHFINTKFFELVLDAFEPRCPKLVA